MNTRRYHVLYATTAGGRNYKHISAENAAVAVHLVQKQVGDQWDHLLDVYVMHVEATVPGRYS